MEHTKTEPLSRKSSYTILTVENGYVVLDGQSEQGPYSAYNAKKWVARNTKELAELIQRLCIGDKFEEMWKK